MSRPKEKETVFTGCLLDRNCGEKDKCRRCGWNMDEAARRRELIWTEGLRRKTGTKIKRLVLIKETKGETAT